MKRIENMRTILAKHKERLTREYKVKEIGIFGSYVRGEAKRRSDVDILVDFYEIPDLLKFIELEGRLGKILGVKVDLVRKPSIRKELKKAILDEVIII